MKTPHGRRGFDADSRRWSSRAATAAAFAILIVAPLVPAALASGTPAALLSLPAESIAAVLILLSIPAHPVRTIAAGVFGAIVVVASLCAGLDLAFGATVDRAFSPTEDWRALVSAFGVVADAAGLGGAVSATALIATGVLTAMILVARAALRVARVTAHSERRGRLGVAALSALWILGVLVGAQLWPGTPLAVAASADALAATSARTGMSIQEQRIFERALASDDLSLAGGEALDLLEGKDVVIAFIESYGRSALENPAFSAGVERVLERGGARLAREGYGAQSAFLTSPTFGGVSWLAHATLQSGVWVDSQQKHDTLMTTERLTLSRIFGDAGWRTVAVVPSNRESWDAGTTFYAFDAVFDSRNMGYRGPPFGYARMPDQYTWKHFHDRELESAPTPVMAEIDFVSSHTPWTPLPQIVPWSQVGDGSVFAAQAEGGESGFAAWSDAREAQQLYGLSVQYTLSTMFSYLHTYRPDDIVLIVVGDHQPSRHVSGAGADHDVPITIITKDPAVLARIAAWQWEAGVNPSPRAPVWRMDLFRDRFVEAFTD